MGGQGACECVFLAQVGSRHGMASPPSAASSASSASSTTSGSRFAACPLCEKLFHRELLARHAARCGVPSAPAAAVKRTHAFAFGSLRPPGPRDIRPSRRRRGLDAPDREFEYLIVLDFEWTADRAARMKPYAEIIEWSCVLLDMARPCRIVSELQIYVKPEHNPVLTAFSKELTAISQDQVDAGCSLETAIAKFEQWMMNLGLTLTDPYTRDEEGGKIGPDSDRIREEKLNFAIVTWSDADLGSTLPTQMRALGIPRRRHFDAWINLKIAFEQVYKKSSRGLKRCVEAIAFGQRPSTQRAVDATNTAMIVLDMVNRQNYRGFIVRRAF